MDLFVVRFILPKVVVTLTYGDDGAGSRKRISVAAGQNWGEQPAPAASHSRAHTHTRPFLY